MRQLELHEYEEHSEPVELTVDQRDRLAVLARSLQIRPAPGLESAYLLRPASDVGAIQLDDLSLVILPKRSVALTRVLYLASYAMGKIHWLEGEPEFDADSLVEAIVPVFVEAVSRAFARGLLQGYRVEEDALLTVRGRIRFDDQLRKRFGRFPPVEVRFDDYTEDIEENRMIRWAAVQRLMTLGEAAARVSDALKSRHPEVPWAELTAFRNVLVHGYFSLRWEIVREAVVNQAPGLEPHIERALKTEFPGQ